MDVIVRYRWCLYWGRLGFVDKIYCASTCSFKDWTRPQWLNLCTDYTREE